MSSGHTVRVDFVCVENAGRSQIAAALAERECERRGLQDHVEIHSGGTDPADAIHENVIAVLDEHDVDVSDRSPSYVVLEELEDSDFLVTMGCTITKFSPEVYGVESRSWEIEDPADAGRERAREIREEIDSRVTALFDDIEAVLEDESERNPKSGGFAARLRDALSL